MEYLPAIISAIGVIITGWFTYNQRTKDKLTDLKIEKWKREESLKLSLKNSNIVKINGELWQLLHDLKADRVYIIQPHPLISNAFISITLEAKRKEIVSMKEVIYKMPIADIAVFCADLAKREFMLYKNVMEEVKDKRAQAILSSNGTVQVIIRRLSDDRHEWVGSIVCEFTRPVDLLPDFARKELLEAANNIQYILPEYPQE